MSYDKKAILVFGAGINQLELILEAKKMDIITVAIDPSADPPGKSFADFFYQVDGKDYENTMAIALKHHINGIVTGQMEKAMRLMAKLALDLDFIFHTPEVVEKSMDKWLMKRAFLENRIPCAKAKLFGHSDDLTINSIKGFPFPLIIKPKDAFSSRGVYRVNSFSEISEYIGETRSFAPSGDILLEEFLEGKEYSVESITFRGTTTVIQITEKFITPFPNTVEMGHLQPAQLNYEQKNEISLLVISAIKAIGIDNSASHTEVMLTSEGPKVIEIGARLGGDFISSYLTKASTGVSMDKAAVQVALGIKPEINPKWQRYSMIKYYELPEGKTVRKITPLDYLLQLDDVVFAYIFVKEGDVINKISHSAQRPACVIIQGNSRSEILEKSEKYANIIYDKIYLE
jgi:biotin carboxylase